MEGRDECPRQARLVHDDCLRQARVGRDDFLQQDRVLKMEGRTLIQFRDIPYKELFNLTAKQEDEKYGCLKAFNEEMLDPVRLFHPDHVEYHIRARDLVWDGMDAAFIEWRGHVKDTNVLDEDLNVPVKRRKVNESIPLKVKDAQIHGNRDAAFIEWHGHIKDTNVLDGDLNVPVKRRRVNESIPLKFRNEFAVANLAYQAILYFDWSGFEFKFGRKKHKEVADRLFVSAVKLVLDIFDQEDFERICYREEICDEHTRFYEALIAEKDYTRVASQLEKEYPLLLESDIYDALCHYVCSYEITRLEPMNYDFAIELLEDHHYLKTHKLMEKHIPLKGHLEAQLLIEQARLKCFHVTDTLLLQAIHSVGLADLFGDCESDEMKSSLFRHLSNCMLGAFNSFARIKTNLLLYGHAGITVSAFNQFGTCTDEVAEVIKLANIERKLGKARYTKPTHYVTVFSVSRVRDYVQEMLFIPERSAFEIWPVGIYTYELCHLSCRLAKEIHKVDGKWGLEYLVFAFLFGPSMENVEKCFYKYYSLFERLRSCESPLNSGKGWKNIDVFMVLLEKRSRYGETIMCEGHEVVNKLHKEIETGNLKLPTYEELRSIC